mgnify:FL=1
MDTFFSLATPPGQGAISIIRISGPMSLDTASYISKKPKNAFIPTKAIITTVYKKQNVLIDKTIIVFFPAPNSYTGDDVIEISCHGSPFVVDQIIDSIIKFGIRLSEPGEFTRTAFINGKMDLVQAEAVAGLIKSRSVRAAEINSNTLRGDLTKMLLKVRTHLVDALSYFEYELDISDDEEINLSTKNKTSPLLSTALDLCYKLLKSYEDGRLYNNGIRVAIIGKPNVGKSTLLNSLIQKNRVITSSVPGTTRDTVDVSFSIRGIPITLVDTAGIRKSNKLVEGLGVERSFFEMDSCDIIIHLLVPDRPSSNDFNFPDKPILRVINKIDLLEPHHLKRLKKEPGNNTFISALLNRGISDLKNIIYKTVRKSASKKTDVLLTTQRQKVAINICTKHIKKSILLINQEHPEFELICVDIKSSIGSLDGLLGKTTADDILNNIFNNFCVGK